MLAQLTGFVRQAAIGYLLGTDPQADALTAAMAPVEIWWSILNVAVDLRLRTEILRARPGRRIAFRRHLHADARLSLVSSICFFLFACPAVRIFAPGMDGETAAMAANLLRVASLTPVAVGCTFVYTALLNEPPAVRAAFDRPGGDQCHHDRLRAAAARALSAHSVS